MRTRFLLATALVALVAARADAAVLINEIAFNPPGTDGPNEYIELRNTDTTAAMIPAGTYLVGIEGDNTANGAGDVQTIFNLGGLSIPASGFLVLEQGGGTYTVDPAATLVKGTGTGWTGVAGFLADSGTDIENTSVSFLLISTATAPTLATDIDTDNDGIPDGATTTAWTVLDSIGILDSDPTDRTYAALTFVRTGGATGPGVTSITFDAGYVARAGNSTGSTAADWIVAEILGTPPALTLSTLGTPTPRTVPNNLAGLPVDNVGSVNFLNDAPTITAPSAFTITEDGSVTFSAAMNTVSIADSDALANPLKLTLTATSGTLTLAAPAGVTFVSGANGTAAMTVTGTLAQLNASLDGLVYAAGANATGTATVTLALDDQGNTGVGGAQTAAAAITFTITAVNDAPVVAVPAMQSVLMSTALPFSTAMGNAIAITDPDIDTSNLTTTVTVTAGTLAATGAGAAVVTGSGTATLGITGTLADTNTTLQSLVFTAPAASATVTLTVSANDGGATGTGGPQTGTGTVMISVSSAPAFTAPSGPLAFTTSLGGMSPAQMVMVMGTNLSGPITVTAPAAFEVSAAAGGPYAATAMLPATGGTYFVRYAPTTGTTHAGNVTYTTPGFTNTATTMLTGTVFRITTASLPSAMVGTAYTAQVTAAGGVAPVTFTVVNPPTWLSISSTGVLSGTPDVDSDPSVMIVATDSQTPAQTTSITLSLTVNSLPFEDAGVDAFGEDGFMVPDGIVQIDAAPRPDAPATGNPDSSGEDGGCCNTSHPAGSLALGALVLGMLLANRRRRAR